MGSVCLVYIDLNMVRAGVVQHPSEWPFGGYYNETLMPKQRYSLINRQKLMNIQDDEKFENPNYKSQINSKLFKKLI